MTACSRFCAPAALLVLLAPSLRAQSDNVLILIADDLGVENVGVYGEGANPPPTPNIDALAGGGVLFRNAWASPLCSPTRACLQTGRHSFRTGVTQGIRASSPNVLRFEETTIPELLDAAASGYAHAAFGKWHLSNQRNGGALAPNLAGWSHFAGMLGGAVNYYLWARTENGTKATTTTYSTTQIVDDAVQWISTAPEPWVCYVAFNAPHAPFHAPPSSLHSQSLVGLDPTSQPVPFYKAMIEAMDTEIGRLIGSLGPASSRTNIIFLGDNGTPPCVVEPPILANRAKGSPYEAGVRVPMIASGPIVQSVGRDVDGLVSVVDVYATVMDLCGVTAMPSWVAMDSISFVPHLVGSGAKPRSTVFAHIEQPPEVPCSTVASAYPRGMTLIRNGVHKLIRIHTLQGSYAEELYDLSADPLEQNNLLMGPLAGEAQVSYAALSDELDELLNPVPTITRFGETRCVGTNGNPRINWSGTPVVGGYYVIRLEDAAVSSPVVLLTGTSNTTWNGFPLPLPLSPMTPGLGCLVYASAEQLDLAMTNEAGSASVPIGIPPTGLLLGATLHHSWLVVDPTAPGNPLGVTSSDGASVFVGN